MKRITNIAFATLIAGVSVSALAADQQKQAGNADKSQVVPSRGQVQESSRAPSASTLDNNAQRQHDRDRDQARSSQKSQPADAKQQPSAGAQQQQGSSASGTGESMGQTRDWSKIDANNDNLIQPEEMESWLKQEGPQAGGSKS